MTILGIPYSTHEVYDLIFYFILFLTLPVGIIKQLYVSFSDNNKIDNYLSNTNSDKKISKKKKKGKN